MDINLELARPIQTWKRVSIPERDFSGYQLYWNPLVFEKNPFLVSIPERDFSGYQRVMGLVGLIGSNAFQSLKGILVDINPVSSTRWNCTSEFQSLKGILVDINLTSQFPF